MSDNYSEILSTPTRPKYVDIRFDFAYNKNTDDKSVLRKRKIYIGLVERPGSNLIGGETPRHFHLIVDLYVAVLSYSG